MNSPGIHQYINISPASCPGSFRVSKYVMSEKTVHMSVKNNHDNIMENKNKIANNVFFMTMILYDD